MRELKFPMFQLPLSVCLPWAFLLRYSSPLCFGDLLTSPKSFWDYWLLQESVSYFISIRIINWELLYHFFPRFLPVYFQFLTDRFCSRWMQKQQRVTSLAAVLYSSPF